VQKQLKILFIRFSSIGDIILTTPIVRCVKLQVAAQVHFLTKKKYNILIENNKYIDKIYLLDNSKTIYSQLEKEGYDYILDLHNNLRSNYIKFKLSIKSYSVSKNILEKYLLINFGINQLNNHVVNRYFKTVNFLNVKNDKLGVDYFLKDEKNLNYDYKQAYLAWCIGGTYEQKKLSINQIKDVIDKVDLPIVLLAGDDEKAYANDIIRISKNKNITNFCGKLSINESAYLIKYSKLFLTNDTGMMHIASSFDVPIISFWGCTKPSLGFYAYQAKKSLMNIESKNSKRPCSRHGSNCRYKKEGCIKTISSNEILKNINSILD
tara:strand:- start:2160 stop:3125 length:966 start_codon:yes stop_codon:yes gene_type:complete